MSTNDCRIGDDDASLGSGPVDAGLQVSNEETSTGERDAEKGQVPGNTQVDPFGDESNAEVKYRTLHWWQAGMIMIAETISLGILSLPSVLATIGMIPGMLLILVLGCLATYTGFVIGQFKLRYPHVHNMADAGEVMLGPIGREVFGFAQISFLVFCMGSHILTFSIMMNTLTSHATCTVTYGVAGTLICLLLTLPRRLGPVSYMAILSFISILSAVTITTVGVAVENPGPSRVALTAHPALPTGFLAVTNIIYAYSGHVAFFNFISELRTPADYPRALFLLQGVDTSLYLLVAALIYRFVGPDVASPALGSTSPLLRKIAYGVAIPTIVIAGVINGHVACKYVYVRCFRGTGLMAQTLFSYGMWALIALGLWTVAWVIAEAIPVFNDLLGLISAVFASWFTYGLSGVFWLFINWGRYRQDRWKMALTGVNVFLVAMGALICVLGLYSSALSIAANQSGAGSQGAFSCKDNSANLS
ncbi:hypothetical protein MMC13_003893 [Lambiella insularis]|nr:hypothetical protein [Lambiella insularis]